MSVTVRFAQLEDLAEINVMRRCVNDLHAQGRPDFFRADAWSAIEPQAQRFLELPDHDIIVAAVCGRLAGFAMVNHIVRPENPYMKERKFYHVEEFGVSADHRRMGVATALIQFMKADARAKGFSRIELDMWEFNEGALKFYEQAGFHTYRRYMELDAQADDR